MIRTVADLLDQIRARELGVMRRYHGVGHQGMIGDMYEGLTRDLLGRAIPPALDLRVVAGKVVNDDGSLSGQMDAMVVVGSGDRLPHTGHHLYPVGQVVAALEVKKTLTGGELSSACAVLNTIGDPSDDVTLPVGRLRRAFRMLARREMPTSGDELDRLHDASPVRAMLFHALVRDAVLPVRVVFGYDGFRSELGFREAMVRHLARGLERASGRDAPVLGYAPAHLPNLVLCGEHALVRMNGMPYAVPLDDDGRWCCMTSARGKSAVLLLEVLWSRLASLFPGLGTTLFGDDLTVEGTKAFLFARAGKVEVDGQTSGGWIYDAPMASAAALRPCGADGEWAPVVVNVTQWMALTLLGDRPDGLAPDDPALVPMLHAEGLDAAGFFRELCATDLVYLDDGGRLRPLVDQFNTAFLPDGRMVAADRDDSRLLRWVDR